jgi:hypothetical protein
MSTFTCPHCGARLAVVSGELDLPAGAQFDRPAVWDHMQPGAPGALLPGISVSPRVQALGDMMRAPTSTATYSTYNYGSAPASQWQEVTFEQPARAASVPSDVQVPALQAAVTGLFVGAGVFVAALFFTLRNHWVWYVPPIAGALAWLVVTGVMWFNLLADSRGLLRRVERYTRKEPGRSPEPEEWEVKVTTETSPGHSKIDGLRHRDETKQALGAYMARQIDRLSRNELRRLGMSSTVAGEVLADLESAGFLCYPKGKTSVSELTAEGKKLARDMTS